jgi:UDPglucose--hexose-1-phosphate uridylyltransferase
MSNINKDIKQLVQYGINQNMLHEEDALYAVNKICDLLGISDYIDQNVDLINVNEPSELLTPILDYAVNNQKIERNTTLAKDIFEAKIMDCLLPRPSELNHMFYQLEKQSAKQATDYYYDLSQKSNYIKTSRTSKNIIWQAPTKYGVLDMTINLSKPEKDPKDIIKSKNQTTTNHIKCLLCKENVGFNGATTNIGRTNHRIIPLSLNEEPFYMQYSPYVYYNEHCIVLHKDHIPMNVSIKTFKRLFDFVDRFDHYFLGSNAGLPIVGGSILSHEHYQGGAHHFPIEDAKVLDTFEAGDVVIEKLYWPLSVLRLKSKNRKAITKCAIDIFEIWENYSDETVGIIHKTTEKHNAITPIARKKNNIYELDITLRNNLTNNDFPLGIFHPHPAHHHIKKENIGLIEVMGLAVLPARLEKELEVITNALLENKTLGDEYKVHHKWYQYLKANKPNKDLAAYVKTETAKEFMHCLENAGVFKQDEKGQKAFDRFIKEVIYVLNK